MIRCKMISQTSRLAGLVLHKVGPFYTLLCLAPFCSFLLLSLLCILLIFVQLYLLPHLSQSEVTLVYSLTSCKVQADLPGSGICSFLIAHQLE